MPRALWALTAPRHNDQHITQGDQTDADVSALVERDILCAMLKRLTYTNASECLLDTANSECYTNTRVRVSIPAWRGRGWDVVGGRRGGDGGSPVVCSLCAVRLRSSSTAVVDSAPSPSP